MCLITTSKKPKIAYKNIVCYKILFGNETPYLNAKVSKLHLWGILPFRAKHKIEVKSCCIEGHCSNYYEIGSGMIHSFQTVEEALRIQKCLNKHLIMPRIDAPRNTNNLKGVNLYTIYKCIIPIGTRYYQDESETYASRKIRFIKRIK